MSGRRQRRRGPGQLGERLRFEILLADLAAAFVEIPAHEIDQRIADGLARMLDELDLDRAGLAELARGARELRLTHAKSRDGLATPPAIFTAERWPWVIGQVREGYAICISRMGDLPPAAARD